MNSTGPTPDFAERAGNAARPGLRVLLVDDNELNRKILCSFMSASGMVFSLAESGREAMELLAAEPFDLVLLDIHMPGMDGTETSERIRNSGEIWAAIPIIAVTSSRFRREEMLAVGMDGYAQKPVSRDHMLAEIERAMLRARLRKSRSGQRDD